MAKSTFPLMDLRILLQVFTNALLEPRNGEKIGLTLFEVGFSGRGAVAFSPFIQSLTLVVEVTSMTTLVVEVELVDDVVDVVDDVADIEAIELEVLLMVVKNNNILVNLSISRVI